MLLPLSREPLGDLTAPSTNKYQSPNDPPLRNPGSEPAMNFQPMGVDRRGRGVYSPGTSWHLAMSDVPTTC